MSIKPREHTTQQQQTNKNNYKTLEIHIF